MRLTEGKWTMMESSAFCLILKSGWCGKKYFLVILQFNGSVIEYIIQWCCSSNSNTQCIVKKSPFNFFNNQINQSRLQTLVTMHFYSDVRLKACSRLYLSNVTLSKKKSWYYLFAICVRGQVELLSFEGKSSRMPQIASLEPWANHGVSLVFDYSYK